MTEANFLFLLIHQDGPNINLAEKYQISSSIPEKVETMKTMIYRC